jgi:ABC-type polysaccharide/polyol phosphate export permease
MAIMAVVFSAILARTVPNYPIFLFSGLIVWNFYANATARGMLDFYGSRSLMSRVYVPKVVFVFAPVSAALVNFLLTLVILLVFKAFTNTPWTSALIFLPVGILVVTVFNLGISMVLAALQVFFIDLQSIYNVFIRLLLYLSAVFYSPDFLPENYQTVLKLIPTFQMISLFREPIYAGVLPSASILLGALAWSLGFLFLGMFTFSALSNRISLNL